jgi:y4mF family transcriptional regulator
MHPKDLGQIIKARREVLAITQMDLAEISNMGLRTLKALENGKTNPTLETLNKVMDVLGMELSVEVRKPNL